METAKIIIGWVLLVSYVVLFFIWFIWPTKKLYIILLCILLAVVLIFKPFYNL